MADLNAWKWRILGGVVISVNLVLLVVNYYIPNSHSHGVISPSVYVGGKYDNTWDYYDHRQIVEKLSQTNEEYIFISNINVFTFLLFNARRATAPDKDALAFRTRRHGNYSEKQRLYSKFSYKILCQNLPFSFCMIMIRIIWKLFQNNGIIL